MQKEKPLLARDEVRYPTKSMMTNLKVKNDHRGKFSNLSSWKVEA